MSSSFAIQANTVGVTVGTTASTVVFQNSITNTFRITTNVAATTDTVFVGVFAGNTAPGFHHPLPDGTTSGAGIPITNAESLFLSGGFGLPTPGNVTVAAICSTGTALVYITPVFTN